MISVPVAWRSRDGSLIHEGVLALEAGALRLQYQSRDWHQGAQRSTARELLLKPDAIVVASFAAGAFWSFPRINLQSSDFASLATLDADQSGHLRFSVRGGQRAAARKLVLEINSLLAEVRFSRWSRDLDRLAPDSTGQTDTDRPPPG